MRLSHRRSVGICFPSFMKALQTFPSCCHQNLDLAATMRVFGLCQSLHCLQSMLLCRLLPPFLPASRMTSLAQALMSINELHRTIAGLTAAQVDSCNCMSRQEQHLKETREKPKRTDLLLMEKDQMMVFLQQQQQQQMHFGPSASVHSWNAPPPAPREAFFEHHGMAGTLQSPNKNGDQRPLASLDDNVSFWQQQQQRQLFNASASFCPTVNQIAQP